MTSMPGINFAIIDRIKALLTFTNFRAVRNYGCGKMLGVGKLNTKIERCEAADGNQSVGQVLGKDLFKAMD